MNRFLDINETFKTMRRGNQPFIHLGKSTKPMYLEWSPPYFLKLIYGNKIMIPYSKLISNKYQPIKIWKELYFPTNQYIVVYKSI